VPTSSEERSIGYSSSNMTIISEPEPTEVMPTTSPPITPISMVGRWPDPKRPSRRRPGPGHPERPSGRADLEQALGGDRGGGQQQRHPQDLLDAGLDHGAVAELAQDQDAGEGGRNRPDHQPTDQGELDGAAAQVDPAADRLHDDRRDQVAGDGGQRLDLEGQHEQGGHERAAAHPGQAHGEADQQPGGGQMQVDLQAQPPCRPIDPDQLDRDTREGRDSAESCMGRIRPVQY
jgi:hypothetical protein